VVPPQLPKRVPEGTSAAFFGVPVTGTNVVFLIDTSGSMEKGPAQPSTGPRRRGENSRLGVAKEQLLLCAQAMAKESRLSVLTFADRVHRWTEAPVAPGTATVRSLTELLGRCRPHGGTNLHDGLSLALQWSQQRYADLGGLQVDELFVLSDGEPTAGAVQVAEDLLTLVRESNRYAKVRIHGVFTGAAGSPGHELLKALAEQNGGVFVHR
jgi:Mg-chelatase subunit ChlD